MYLYRSTYTHNRESHADLQLRMHAITESEHRTDQATLKHEERENMTQELSRTSGGYDVGDTTVYSSQGPLAPSELASLSCSKCKLIPRDPKQVITCGHRYCKTCIEQLTLGR